MTEQASGERVAPPQRPLSRRSVVIASCAAGALVLGAGISSAVVLRSYSLETEQLCATALSDYRALLSEELSAARSDAATAIASATPAGLAAAVTGAGDIAPSRTVQDGVDAAERALEDASQVRVKPTCTDRTQLAALATAQSEAEGLIAGLTTATAALADEVRAFSAAEQQRIDAARARADAERRAKEAAEREAAAAADEAALVEENQFVEQNQFIEKPAQEYASGVGEGEWLSGPELAESLGVPWDPSAGHDNYAPNTQPGGGGDGSGGQPW